MSKLTPKPETQVGGTHYSDLAIEPIQFIEANGLDYCEGNAVKYISRWKNKNGLEDLVKARWYIERLIQNEEARIEEENEVNAKLIMQEMHEKIVDACTIKFGPGCCETQEEQELKFLMTDNHDSDLKFFNVYSLPNEDLRKVAKLYAESLDLSASVFAVYCPETDSE